MEAKLEILILVLVFSSLFVIYSGNDKTTLGKKIKAIGFQLFGSGFFMLGAGHLVSDSALLHNVFFYTGALMCMVSFFQLGKILKQSAIKSA